MVATGINTASPTALLHVGGAYTTVNTQPILINPTLSSTATAQYGLVKNVIYTPTGGTLASIFNETRIPTLNCSNYAVTDYIGCLVRLDTGAGFTGPIQTGAAYDVLAPGIGGVHFDVAGPAGAEQ